ncbi:MAG: ROK family protein [Vicinamibacterales bacterium]
MHAGIDLSATPARAVLAGEDGRVAGRADGDQLAAALAAQAPEARGLGVATALPGDEVPAALAAAIAEAWPRAAAPVVVAAGGALALAEAETGAAAGASDVVAFAIDTHVIAGIVTGGRLWRGARGLAGSVGWLALNPVEREDYRRYGGLEAEVSAAGIVRRLAWRVKAGDYSRAADAVGGDFGRLAAADILAAARDGDGVSVSVVRDTARYVGMAVANLASVADPEVIVLGGLLAAWGDLVLEPIRAEVQRRLGPRQGATIRVELAALGDDAVALGAARAARLEDR